MRKILLIGLVFSFAIGALAATPTGKSRLRSIRVRRPNIVVRGAHLSKVEIWAVPTGTEITEKNYTLLGTAKRINSAGSNEIWVFPIDCDDTRLLATTIFAKGFDLDGKAVGTIPLPYIGATEVLDGLCGNK
jgi:hypothetical protein